MAILLKLAAAAVPLLLLTLTAIAGYAYSQVRYLSLPISQALGLFTVVLPLITGISTQGVYSVIQRSSRKENYQLTIPLIAVIGFQLIYETIIATLAMTYMLPPSALNCGLDQKWQQLFVQGNGKAMRAIQESFDCCGFNSVNDRAFPFNKSGRSECAKLSGRTKSCVGEWRKAEQTNAGFFLLVALIVFVIKVVSLIALLTGPSWAGSKWVRPFRRHTTGDVEQPEEDNRAHMRRLIEDSDAQEEYHDEPAQTTSRAIEAPADTQYQGPRVEPSPMIDAGNEWRNV